MQTDHARWHHTPQNEWLSVRTDGPEWEVTEMLLRGGWWWSHRLLAQWPPQVVPQRRGHTDGQTPRGRRCSQLPPGSEPHVQLGRPGRGVAWPHHGPLDAAAGHALPHLPAHASWPLSATPGATGGSGPLTCGCLGCSHTGPLSPRLFLSLWDGPQLFPSSNDATCQSPKTHVQGQDQQPWRPALPGMALCQVVRHMGTGPQPWVSSAGLGPAPAWSRCTAASSARPAGEWRGCVLLTSGTEPGLEQRR